MTVQRVLTTVKESIPKVATVTALGAVAYLAPKIGSAGRAIQAAAVAGAAYVTFSGVTIAKSRLLIGPYTLPGTGGKKIGVADPDPKEPLQDIARIFTEVVQKQPPNEVWVPRTRAAAPVATAQTGEIQAVSSPAYDPNNSPSPVLPPDPSPEELDYANDTNRQIDLIIEHSSAHHIINFIHKKQLGLPFIHPNRTGSSHSDDTLIFQIAKEAATPDANGEKPSLASVYMKYCGHQLSFLQKVGFYFWYYLTPIRTIITSSTKILFTNIRDEFRKNLVNANKSTPLNTLIKTFLEQSSSFLFKYEKAMKDFAAEGNGSPKDYRKKAIEKLTEKSMKELCIDFTDTAVDLFFPRASLFNGLKNIPALAWLGEVLDFLLGPIIHWIVAKILKWVMPSTIETFVNTNIASTNSTNLSFASALINNIAGLFNDLAKDFSKGEMDTTPVTPPAGSEALPTTVNRLLNVLELLNTEESQEAVKQTLEKISGTNSGLIDKVTGKVEKAVRSVVEEGIVLAVYKFFNHLEKNPRTAEKYFSLLIKQFNGPYAAGFPTDENGDPVSSEVLRSQRDTDYKRAKESLDDAGKKFLEVAILGAAKAATKGPSSATDLLKPIHDARRTSSLSAFGSPDGLEGICRTIQTKAEDSEQKINIYVELDHAKKVIEKFAAEIEPLKLQGYPENTRKGFYRSFHSIHDDARRGAKNIEALLDLQLTYDKTYLLHEKYSEIGKKLTSLLRKTTESTPLNTNKIITELQQLSKPIAAQLLSGSPEPAYYSERISQLKDPLSQLNEQQERLLQLQKLTGEGLVHQLYLYATNKPQSGFNLSKCTTQIHQILDSTPNSTQLKNQISSLQQKPSPEIYKSIQELIAQHINTQEDTKQRIVQALANSIGSLQTWVNTQGSHFQRETEELQKNLLTSTQRWGAEIAITLAKLGHKTIDQVREHLDNLEGVESSQIDRLISEIEPIEIEKQYYLLQHLSDDHVAILTDLPFGFSVKEYILKLFKKSDKLIEVSDELTEAATRMFLDQFHTKFKYAAK